MKHFVAVWAKRQEIRSVIVFAVPILMVKLHYLIKAAQLTPFCEPLVFIKAKPKPFFCIAGKHPIIVMQLDVAALAEAESLMRTFSSAAFAHNKGSSILLLIAAVAHAFAGMDPALSAHLTIY